MRKIFRRGKVGFLLVLFLTVFISRASAVDLPSINKSKIRLLIAPGKAEYGEMIVENQSAEPRSMRVYLSDWEYLPAADGTKEFLPVGSTPLSCASWISFSPAEFTLAPFSKQKIDYAIKVPASASGGYYAGLFFESVFAKAGDVPKEGMQVGMNLVIRIATLFYLDVDGSVKRTAQIDNLTLKKDVSAKQYIMGLDFRNRGNVDIVAGGTFHIMNSEGLVISRGALNDLYTFPGASGKFSALLKDKLPEGKYDLVFTINLGKALEEAGIGRGPVITQESELSIGQDGKVLDVGLLK